jgi:hypothetical protein
MSHFVGNQKFLGRNKLYITELLCFARAFHCGNEFGIYIRSIYTGKIGRRCTLNKMRELFYAQFYIYLRSSLPFQSSLWVMHFKISANFKQSFKI